MSLRDSLFFKFLYKGRCEATQLKHLFVVGLYRVHFVIVASRYSSERPAQYVMGDLLVLIMRKRRDEGGLGFMLVSREHVSKGVS